MGQVLIISYPGGSNCFLIPVTGSKENVPLVVFFLKEWHMCKGQSLHFELCKCVLQTVSLFLSKHVDVIIVFLASLSKKDCFICISWKDG